jgi:hypothetical protein
LRVLLRGDEKKFREVLENIKNIEDQSMRSQAAQALFSQTNRFLELYSAFDRLCDAYSGDAFISTFEQTLRNLID